MTTISINVEDSFVDTLQTMLRGFIEQKKIQIIDENKSSFTVNSIDEVKKRVYEAEKRIHNNGGIDEQEYEEMMNNFFTTKLGISR